MASSNQAKLFCLQSKQLSLHMTPSMCQSLRVLEMPIEELSLWIEEEVDKNPLLERGEASYRSFFISADQYTLEEPKEHFSRFSYLMNQAKELFQGEKDSLLIAEWIIGNLDDRGLYCLLDDEIPRHFPKKMFETCLIHIQETLDPPGIGARTIQESLLLQLQRQGKKNKLSYRIIQTHFAELLQQKYTIVQKKFSIDRDTLLETIEKDIVSLHPFPGSFLCSDFCKSPPSLIPDVWLQEEAGEWRVYVQDPPEPQDSPYMHLKGGSQEDRLFFSSYRREAKWLRQTIAKRKGTLKKIVNYLVDKQKAYLCEGNSSLSPLTMQQASEDLSLHKSTILRAVSGKYLSCPLGTIPIRYLFAKPFDKGQKLLQRLIASESKESPLSDRELLEKMRDQGVFCSRRTLTKYRQKLQIPARHLRKR